MLLRNEIKDLRSPNVTAERNLSDLLAFHFTDEEQTSKKIKRFIFLKKALRLTGGSDNRTQAFGMRIPNIWGGKCL